MRKSKLKGYRCIALILKISEVEYPEKRKIGLVLNMYQFGAITNNDVLLTYLSDGELSIIKSKLYV